MLRWRTKHNCDYRLICNTDIIIDDGRKGMKELMLGNKAVARGLYEAGCKVISSYPGTPSTEITEEAAAYNEIYCEWAPNERLH